MAVLDSSKVGRRCRYRRGRQPEGLQIELPGNPLLHWLGSVIARKAHNVGERRFTVDEHPALPLPDGPVPDGRNTFSHLIRMDPLSTIVTISIDVFSATVATAVGLHGHRGPRTASRRSG